MQLSIDYSVIFSPHFANTFSVICNAMRTVHKFEITVNTKNLSDEKIKFPMQN
jgi:hypothetical protein